MRAQLDYWRRHPPVHTLLAAYVGYEAEGGGGARSTEASHDAVQALMAMAPELPAHLRSPIPNPYARH
jgi:hypothetical protein